MVTILFLTGKVVSTIHVSYGRVPLEPFDAIFFFFFFLSPEDLELSL